MEDFKDTNKRIRLVMDLRSKGISDTRVLSAIERVDRAAFAPEELTDQAWEDMALPIGSGQTISQPFVVAKMTQVLDVGDRDKVLEIGTGCGYQTAILSQLARRVYTIERHKILTQYAEQRFDVFKYRNITTLVADGMLGWPTINGIDQAPFDKIMVTAAAREKPPEALISQLKIGGAMMIPVGEPGAQKLTLFKRETPDTLSKKEYTPVRFVPLLPDVAEDGPGQAESVT